MSVSAECDRFREEDFERVFHLYQATMGAHIARAFGWDEAFQRANMYRTLTAPGVCVYRSDDRIAAFFVTRAKDAAVEIFLLCVDEAFQRRGLGARMIGEIERAAGRGAMLVGTILPSVDVAAFYESLGFKARPRDDGGFRIEKRLRA